MPITPPPGLPLIDRLVGAWGAFVADVGHPPDAIACTSEAYAALLVDLPLSGYRPRVEVEALPDGSDVVVTYIDTVWDRPDDPLAVPLLEVAADKEIGAGLPWSTRIVVAPWWLLDDSGYDVALLTGPEATALMDRLGEEYVEATADVVNEVSQVAEQARDLIASGVEGLLASGLTVQVSPALPVVPSPGEDARRIVRHGMADVLMWLGEDVGAAPGVETHAFLVPGTLFVSPEMYALLRAEAQGFPVGVGDGDGDGNGNAV